MKKYFRTDLASELFSDPSSLPRGVSRRVDTTDSGFRIERYSVSPNADTDRPSGEYVTLYCGTVWELDEEPFSDLVHALAAELRSSAERLTKITVSPSLSVLVVGLGNADMTPDALGPDSVSSLNVTRHLKTAAPELFEQLSCCLLSAISPGVLGKTGIETVTLVRAAVDSVRPDLVIAIDALAAQSLDRLASTVQLGDGGIRPGSGVLNRREALDRDSLGVPVLALGAPTVVDSSTLVADALLKAGQTELSPELEAVLDSGRSYFVAPKEADAVNKSLCRLFSEALNLAFGISLVYLS